MKNLNWIFMSLLDTNKLKKYDIFKDEKILKLELLPNQGFCNLNYLLTTSRDKYIIKEYDKFLHRNVSKKIEFHIQLKSYKNGISAKPFILDFENQMMISEFIDGNHKLNLNKTDIYHLAKILYRLHTIKIHQKPYDIKKYFIKNSKKIDKELKITLLKLDKFNKESVLCHNDLNPKNIIFANKVKLIDWEFACVNDKYFDLASTIIEFNLTKSNEKYFLQSYFKDNTNINKEKLKIYKILYKHICEIWFANLGIIL